MTIDDIAMESRAIVDAQYAVHAPDDAADHSANNRSDWAGIMVTDASAMGSAIRHTLSMCSG